MPTVAHDRLEASTDALLRAMGSDPAEAAIVSRHLVEANLRGHDSHGVGMVPHYVRNWEAGVLHLNRHLELVRDDGPFLLGDGQGGHGQVVARELAELAVGRARETGVAIAGLRYAHHIGRVGSYGEQAADAGFISIHFVNVAGHDPGVAPFRGTDARFLTNPVCVAVPATDTKPAIVLDFATSKIALGKVRVAMNRGKPVADGVLLDHTGAPTTDPSVMFRGPRGAVTTMGDHKGYGLALMGELLGAALTGGLTIPPHRRRDLGIRNNMLMIVIDPARLTELDQWKAEIDAVVDYYKASPPANPDEPVLVAGEPELISRAERLANGIAMDETTWEELRGSAETVGLGAEKFTELAG